MGDEVVSMPAMAKAIHGERVGLDARNDYDREDIYGSGSVNIRAAECANDSWYCIHHDRARLHAPLGAARTAFTQRAHNDIEPFCRFVYGPWNFTARMALYGAAVKAGDGDLEEAIAKDLNTHYLLMRLSAGWEAYKARGIQGWRVTMTGARSWVADRPDGERSYRNGNGAWYTPYDLDASGLDHILWWLAGNGSAVKIVGDVASALSRHGIRPDRDARIVPKWAADLNSPDAEKHLAAIQRLPRVLADGRVLPKIPAVVIRTTEAVAWLCLKSINSGSTHFRYGSAWSPHPIQDSHGIGLDYPAWRRDRRCAWLVADDPTRTGGVAGRARYSIDGGRVRMACQAQDGLRWHPQREWEPGWNELDLPGRVISVVELGPRGCKVVYPRASQPPDPGPGPAPPTPSRPRKSDWVKYRVPILAAAAITTVVLLTRSCS